MDAKKPALILNPAAGPVWRRMKGDRLIKHLHSLYPNLTVLKTVHGGDARRFTRELASGPCDLILAAGGDGTYHEVINGLGERPIPIGILPMGSGNSLVREVGLPLNPFKAATAIRHGIPRPIFLGKINGRCFTLMLGAGFDADIVHRVTAREKRLGMLAYLWVGILRVFQYHFSDITFKVDGHELKGTSGIIAKSRCYGGPFTVVPRASLSRAELVLCLFKGRGPLTYIRYALGVMVGIHHRMRDIEFHTGTRMEIASPVPLQIDGEPAGMGPARISIAHRPITIVYPDNANRLK